MAYPVKSLTLFSFTTGEQTGETFYNNIFIYVKSKYCIKNTIPPSPPFYVNALDSVRFLFGMSFIPCGYISG
ncbi:hypothetical protein, partial [uncultured Bilophila sp.]|uniref:hypothetical protein n=1 Tax=uncultured Bilophila sp. TaxID=529385 RepID=UPI0025ED51CE